MSKRDNHPKTRSKNMKHFPQNPSFSSALLDEIYRSIDDDPRDVHDQSYHRETEAGKRSEEEERATSLRRARLIDKWMEKKGSSEKVQHVSSQRKPPWQSQYSLEDLEKKFYHHDHIQQHDVVIPFSNSSSSSDSSSGGFSSSETDSFYVSKTKSSCITAPWPRPVRTNPTCRATKSTNPYITRQNPFEDYANRKNLGDRNLNDSFVKSKSKASKFYSNLKNMKQPVSPGMRLSSLIGSLFVKDNNKNKKTMTKGSDSRNEVRKLKSEPPSTCSSTSSFTRSCMIIMSRTSSPCSEPRMQTGMRKSVRLVSTTDDQDDARFRQKGISKGDDHGLISSKIDGKKLERALPKRYQEIKRLNEIEKSRELEDIALGLLNGYWNGKEKDGHARNASDSIKPQIQDHDHDNDLLDRSSCSSSDLFELDHLKLAARDELPVYETTKLSKDQSCQR